MYSPTKRMKPAALAAALVLAVQCGGTPDAPLPDARPNVVIVMADTLRAQNLSAYGYGRETSPRLEGVAAEGTLFERARSQAACTFPSVNSLLTSRYPARFLGQDDESMSIPDDEPMLPVLLAEAGWRTAAVSASPIVRRTPSKYNPDGGFARGFEVFDEHCLWRSGACVTRTALQLASSGPEPFFLYLHYMDPHGPYAPPPEHERRWAGEYRGGHEFIAAGDPQPLASMVYNDGPAVNLGPGDLEHLRDLYDESIAYFDSQLGLLVDGLEARRLLERTVLVVLGDHGEELLEGRDHVEHCRVAFDTSTRTPLVVRGPGVSRGSRVAAAVENVDVVPTLLELLGVPAPDGLHGESLVPLLRTGAGEGLAFALQYPWASVDDGRYKLLVGLDDGSRRLYDVVSDPFEHSDVSGERPDVVERLEVPLRDWVAREVDAVRDRPALAESLDQLKALGYLQ